MAGVQIGSMFWSLALRSNVRAGAEDAKIAINDLDESTKRSVQSFDLLDQATGKNTKGLQSTGTSAMMFGGALIGAGAAAQQAGGDIANLAGPLEMAGGVLMTTGSIATALPPIIRSIGWAHESIIPSIMGHTGALGLNTATMGAASIAGTTLAGSQFTATTATEALTLAGYNLNPSMIALAASETAATGATISLTAALTALGAVTVVGLVVAGLYLLYENMNASKQAAKALDDEIKTLSSSMSVFGQQQEAMNFVSKEAETAYNAIKNELSDTDNGIKTLTDHYRELNNAMKDQAGIASDLSHNTLNIKTTMLDLADVEKELKKPTGDPEETARNKIRRDELRLRLQDLQNEKRAIEDRNAADSLVITKAETETKTTTPEEARAKYLQDIQKLEDKRITLIGEEEIAQGKLLDLQKESLRVETERAKIEFRKELVEYQKEGTQITPEMYEAAQSVPWMKGVMDQFVRERGTVTTPPSTERGAELAKTSGEIYPFMKPFVPLIQFAQREAAASVPQAFGGMETKINPVLANIPYEDYYRTGSPYAPFKPETMITERTFPSVPTAADIFQSEIPKESPITLEIPKTPEPGQFIQYAPPALTAQAKPEEKKEPQFKDFNVQINVNSPKEIPEALNKADLFYRQARQAGL